MTRPTGLPLTGERTVPGVWHENYWYQRHLAAYSSHLVTGVVHGYVLEAGCGEGYGAELLRERCDALVALDYDASTVAYVRAVHAGIPVLRGNLVALPLRAASLDTVVSLQTVEHLWDQDAFVAECIRVLRPDGNLVVSTPNRLTFSPGLAPGEAPRNPFHTRELDPGDLFDLLNEHASVDTICGLRHGPSLELWEQTYGSVVEAQLAEPYTAWDDHLVELVTSLTVDDFTLDASDLATTLDLIAVVTPR
jgi:SAM-dependent methyltransferase